MFYCVYLLYCLNSENKNKKRENFEKYENSVSVYTSITCSLDEHSYAQLSNVSFVARLCDLYDLVNLLTFISLSLFLTGMTKKSYEKDINNHLTTKTR